MSTQIGHFIQDQNLNIHLDGASARGKSNLSKVQKKGGLGGRKALNDISNSGKSSALQPSRKHNSNNVIYIGDDLRVSKTKHFDGGKTNVSKATEKSQVGGRRALTDVTNSRSFTRQVTKNIQAKKLSVLAESLPNDVAEEGFLHNHQNCIKAQRNGVDKDYFLKMVGLDDDIPMQIDSSRIYLSMTRNSKPETPLRHLIMEEIPELMIEDQPSRCSGVEFIKENNWTVCGSPNSPKPYVHLQDCYNYSDFILAESP